HRSPFVAGRSGVVAIPPRPGRVGHRSPGFHRRRPALSHGHVACPRYHGCMRFERRRMQRRWFFRLPGFVLLFLVLAPAALLLPWRWVPPPASAFMLHHAREHGRYDYRWTPLERISPCLAAAVIAAEDQKFPRHFRVDLDSIRHAVAERER